MVLSEINKLMAWMMGVFPAWKPDKGVSIIWAKEIPDFSANIVMGVVRLLMQKNPSSFPPNVFQIKEHLAPKSSLDKFDAKTIFNALWSKSSFSGFEGNEELKEIIESEKVQNVLRMTGDDYDQCLIADKPWHEKRFVEIYNSAKDRCKDEHLRLITEEQKRLSEKQKN